LIDIIRSDLKAKYPEDVIDSLLNSYTEIKENYYLQKHEPSELNGGKFVEAFVRLLQFIFSGTFTPIGTTIHNIPGELRLFENKPTTFHDSLRLHIPRGLVAIYNIRNRRGVGHLGGDVNPNLADATLIATLADWSIAELYRIEFNTSVDDAQKIVEQLVRRKLLLLYAVNGVQRVLDPDLSYKDQTLVLLAAAFPNELSISQIQAYIEHPNLSNLRTNVIRPLHKKRMIDMSGQGQCKILPTGLNYVENNYDSWISKLNRR